jgi:hypothetical protein
MVLARKKRTPALGALLASALALGGCSTKVQNELIAARDRASATAAKAAAAK